MSAPKALFLRNADLSNRWRAMANSETFDEAAAFCLAAMAEQAPSREYMIGANKMLEWMRHIAEPDKEVEPITSGLHHDVTVRERNEAKGEAK